MMGSLNHLAQSQAQRLLGPEYGAQHRMDPFCWMGVFLGAKLRRQRIDPVCLGIFDWLFWLFWPLFLHFASKSSNYF